MRSFSSDPRFCLPNRIQEREHSHNWYRTLVSPLCTIVLCALIGSIAAFPRTGSAQLGYDSTSFLHGFASGPGIWTRSYPDIQSTPPNYLRLQVDLRGVSTPNLDSTVAYAQQVVNLANALRGGRHVLPSHSLGSMVARGTYIDSAARRPNIAGIIAIAPLHQGAPLADNYTQAKSFFADAQRRIEEGLDAVRSEAQVLNFLFWNWVAEDPTVQGIGIALVSIGIQRFPGQVINFSNINAFGNVPAFNDLKVNSAAVMHLNSRTDDAAIPRANLYGTIPHRNAALRVLYSSLNKDSEFEAAVVRRNQAVSLFKGCRLFGYATIVMIGSGRRCGFAVRVLGRIDDRWVKYVNGSDQYGQAKVIPFDGIVPNERARYPSPNGVSYEFRIDGVNHQNIYKTRLGLDRVAIGMSRIGMGEATGGPPPPPPPSGISVNVSGSNPTDVGCPGVWNASPQGGVAPYTYVWTVDGTPYNTGSGNDLYYTPQSAGMLAIWVTATDSQGATGTGQMSVTVTSYGNCY